MIFKTIQEMKEFFTGKSLTETVYDRNKKKDNVLFRNHVSRIDNITVEDGDIHCEGEGYVRISPCTAEHLMAQGTAVDICFNIGTEYKLS